MRIAIITRSDDRSPKVLALSLSSMLDDLCIENKIFFESGHLIRMQPLSQKLKRKIGFLKRLYQKIKFNKQINDFLNKLKEYDLVIFCECTPNGFWKGYYAIEELRKKIQRPVLFYEVYYLGNAPTQIVKLKKAGDPCQERYDWHLSVTDVTEIKSRPGNGWSRIGLNLFHAGLKPVEKKEFIVLVDFEQEGYELHRMEQIEVLEELNVKYISLRGSYTINEIRSLYKQASAFFIQFPEAFGVPIAECLASGAYIFTPSSSWPMSWRLDENPKIHSAGKLPDVFIEYSTKKELGDKLLLLKNSYNFITSPKYVFDSFLKNYAHYYYGDLVALKDTLSKFY